MYEKGHSARTDTGLHDYALFTPLIMEILILLWSGTSIPKFKKKRFLTTSEFVGVI